MADALEQLMRGQVDQMTTMCLLRWKSGAKQGATLKEHCIAYFQPNDFAVKQLRTMATTLKTDPARIETIYKAMVEASRMKWAEYTDAQAQQVLDDWFRPKPPSN